ncbi:MAG: ubiquinol-cytochrome c reductase iron-sulfur subunit [Pseudonocardiales bacterium]|nr:ubiquinol-cytochrome c reductase iron-sulfur subunit [Pseudonocardiales bacterium]
MSETPPTPRPRRLLATIKRATTEAVIPHDEQPATVVDPAAEKRAERQVALLFLLSAGCTVGFAIGYSLIGLKSIRSVELSNYVLGLTLTGALGFLGIGLVLWTKLLMPHYRVAESRHPLASTETERQEFAEVFSQGLDEMGIARRPILRRSLLLAAGMLPLPAIFMLRDLGPKPEKTLFHTRWTKDARLVDIISQQPVRVGDLEIGGLLTVMPEGVKIEDKDAATSPSVLIRLRPGENVAVKGREDWAPEGYVAYNKICTHAGCPIGLYEQQTHQLFCPCHQSTFDVLRHCRVVFGPAARALPQLPIYIDPNGYFRARSDFTEPVGPSFWERG